MRVLVVGGSPVGITPSRLREIARTADKIVAVDRGFDYVCAAGLTCALFCGDADSVSETGARLLEQQNAAHQLEVERYHVDKDYSDLHLALDAVAQRWGSVELVASAMSGGRPDHYLDVLGQLLRWPASVELQEDHMCGRILHPGEAWNMGRETGVASGDTFSFIALSPEACVSLSGMQWELNHRRCYLLEDVGLSNRVRNGSAELMCHEGRIACWLFPSSCGDE
ncbi:thiamine diphosphokinase [Collinsella sp. zg1085]|uniref:thiamine diphosphokinase n=1 Tax=Collinsella sp. zg1085 TaxID=2844380 RepID=UPI001C0AD25E|nr:thiamine diphosphokinase [Collinsella sp. zg1085]QWT17134.1 thiamine diphosphokinase [Collinsella sp. zg1085]